MAEELFLEVLDLAGGDSRSPKQVVRAHHVPARQLQGKCYISINKNFCLLVLR